MAAKVKVLAARDKRRCLQLMKLGLWFTPACNRLQSIEPELRANIGIDRVREPNQTATPKAVELRLITAVEQNMAELGHAPLDESASEQAEFSERTVGTVSAKRDK